MKKEDDHNDTDEKKEYGAELVGTSKGTSHWLVRNCSKVWWPCVASFSL